MPLVSTQQWKSLERRSSTAFLVAGVMFVVDAALVGAMIAGVADRLLLVGQAFIAAGWTAGFIGLLGSYSELADRSTWLARAGATFVVIGIVVFVVMGIASLAYFADVLSGDLQTLVPIFLPGVIIGSVLGFLTFGVASLRTEVHSRTVGVLFIVLALFPVVNILSGVAGFERTLTFAIVIGLALVNFAIGYLLRNEDSSTGDMEVEPSHESAT